MTFGCPFCDDYTGLDNHLGSRVIHHRPGYFLIPTLGCFTAGYCLYIPTKHLNSFASLGLDELRTVDSHVVEYSEIIKKEFRTDLIVAEHGAGSATSCGASCLNHAHLHFIPVEDPPSVLHEYLKIGRTPKIHSHYSEVAQYDGRPYIYIRWKSDQHLVWTNAEAFPRQFVRIVCATQHGLGDMFNWRIFPFHENIKATKDRLAEYYPNTATLAVSSR